jgi:hypothetical protein
MGMWAWLKAEKMCAQCGQRPRAPDLQIPAELAAHCVVRPADYCTAECVEEANSGALW